MGAALALEIVPPGQFEQSAPGERIRPFRHVARPLHEAPVELFHDATPATSLKAEFQRRAAKRSRAEEISDNFQQHCCTRSPDGPTLPEAGEIRWQRCFRAASCVRRAASRCRLSRRMSQRSGSVTSACTVIPIRCMIRRPADGRIAHYGHRLSRDTSSSQRSDMFARLHHDARASGRAVVVRNLIWPLHRVVQRAPDRSDILVPGRGLPRDQTVEDLRPSQRQAAGRSAVLAKAERESTPSPLAWSQLSACAAPSGSAWRSCSWNEEPSSLTVALLPDRTCAAESP